MHKNIYTLPDVSFVGGETQELYFYMKNKYGYTIDLSNITKSNFSLCNYSNKTGSPILTYTPVKEYDSNNILSVLHVTIPHTDTAYLYGKFIYQLVIFDNDGQVDIPNHGILNITKNIYQSIVS